MGGSFPIGRIFGSEIRIHLTFLLLLAWVAISSWSNGGSFSALDSVLFIVSVFGCVLLHELGHAIAARRYGISTPDITLYPIGGLARLSRIPEKPLEEVVIALAGPAVNLAIAAILLAFGARLTLDVNQFATYGEAFMSRLAVVNLSLLGFNLIPAFPMDGGRVLRALLALRIGRARATQIAARIGQFLAFGFAAYGLYSGDFILVIIGFVIFLAAAAEASQATLRDLASRLAVDDAMIRVFEWLPPDATFADAADAIMRTGQRELPVVDDSGRFLGILGRQPVSDAFPAGRRDEPISSAITAAPVIPTGTRLVVAVRLLAERGAPAIGIVDRQERLIGYLTPQSLADFSRRRPSERQPERGPWGSAAA
jgi:stage IV sporulation protein FB